MRTSNNWLEKRKNRERLLARTQNIAIGSLIAAITIGPLIYFAAVAVPIEIREARNVQLTEESAATPEIAIEIPATPEISLSEKPIKFPEPVKEIKKIENPKVEFKLSDLPKENQQKEIVSTGKSESAEAKFIDTLKTEFKDQEKDVQIKVTNKQVDGQNEKLVVMENLDIDDGPRQIRKTEDADTVARAALRKYLKTNPKEVDFDIYTDTSKLTNSKKTYQLVVSDIKTNNGKWYVTFEQYKNALPVFDGNIKMIFTERKNLIAITDNIRTDFPEIEDFSITNSEASGAIQDVFTQWDEGVDKIGFVNKGYYKNKPAFKIELESHNPLGNFEVLVDGSNGDIENVKGDIRLADETGYTTEELEGLRAGNPLPYNPVVDKVDPVLYDVGERKPEEENQVYPSVEELDQIKINAENTALQQELIANPVNPEAPQLELQRSEIFQKIIAPVYAEEKFQVPEQQITGPSIGVIQEFSATGDAAATPDVGATLEPDIVILDTIFSQVLGKIYPQTPDQEPIITPFANAYTFFSQKQNITDEGGYFENKDLDWYSVYLDGPYVTVYDDDASSDAEIKDRTPEDPFVWDENSASLAAINAFYHTNEMHKYFADKFNFDTNKKIPVTVNSELVDQYLNGCGAWFDNSDKSIEMGRGGTDTCPEDLNYALSSDFVYHEYTHFVVEEITHLPNITGAESAAMGEGLADYFAASANNDPVWGDVVAPNDTRNLKNTLNYNYDLNGESHHDGQIFAGALWDLRTLIGPIEADKLVFNTLYQDRLHFETFMYGMLIEDDDNNDFSDGTPHMLEILAAFENHGIGPGIANFDGLPVDPEAWTDLLGEEAPQGQEDSILNAISAGCEGYDDGTSIVIPDNVTCTFTGSGSRSIIYLAGGADLYIGDSSTYGILSTSGDTSIYGTTAISSLRIGWYSGVYGRLTVGDELFLINGGWLYSGYDGSNFANANTYLHVTGSTQIYKQSTSYTSSNFVSIYNDATSDNNLGVLYIGRSDTSTSFYGNQSYFYNGGSARTNVDYFRLDNGGYINNYTNFYVTTSNSDILNGSIMYNRSSAIFNNAGYTTYVWDDSLFDNDGTVNSNSFDFRDSAELNMDGGTINGTTAIFYNTSWLDLNAGTFNVTTATYNNSTNADVAGGDFSPTTANFYTTSYVNHYTGGSTHITSLNLYNSSFWNHYGGTTSIGNFNMNDTSYARANTSGQTLTATSFNLYDSAVLEKAYYSAASNGDGNISATNIWLQGTSSLDILRSTGSVTASGTITVDDDSQYYQSTGSTTASYFSVVGTTQTTQSGELYLTGGTLTVSTRLLINENGWVNQDGGTVDAVLGQLNSNAAIYDQDGGTADFDTLRMYLNSHYQNDSAVIIRVGGGNMTDTSVFENNYTAGGTATVTIPSGLTGQQSFLLDTSAHFYNRYGGSFTTDTSGSSNGDTIDVIDSSTFDNYGTLTTYNLRIGWNDVDKTQIGGFYHNLYTTYESKTNVHGDLIMYRGYMSNDAGSTTAYGVVVSGNVNMKGYWQGTICDNSDLENSGLFSVSGNITMTSSTLTPAYTCTEINNFANASTLHKFSAANITSTYDYSDITNAGDFYVTTGSINMTSTHAFFQNSSSGYVSVYDDFIIDSTGAYAVYLDNSGDFNVGISTTSSLQVAGNSYVDNNSGGTINVDDAATTSTTRGQFTIYQDGSLVNEGDVSANLFWVDSGGGTSVTGFENQNGGTITSTYSGSATYGMKCIYAICQHKNTATSLTVASGLLVQSDLSYITNFIVGAPANINNAYINWNSMVTINSNATLTASGQWQVLDDQNATIPDYDGQIVVTSGSTFNGGSSANVYLGGPANTGGEIDNSGSFYANNLTLYDSSLFTNQSTGDVGISNTLQLAYEFTPSAFIRSYENYGSTEATYLQVYGDNSIFNSDGTSAQIYINNDLDINGGKLTVASGSVGATIDGNAYIYYKNGSTTSGELYNFDNSFVVAGKMYVSGFVQNGNSLFGAAMEIRSNTGSEDLYVHRGVSADGYGKFLNSGATLTVGDASGGEIKVEGIQNISLPGSYYIALFQNSEGAIHRAGHVNTDEMYIKTAADLLNYTDLNVNNKLWTGEDESPKTVTNYATGDIDVIGDGDSWFYNNSTVTNSGTFDATGTSGIMKVMQTVQTTTLDNYGTLSTDKLWNGSSAEYYGGTTSNLTSGTITVNDSTSDTAQNYGGTIIQNSSGSIDISSGRFTTTSNSGSYVGTVTQNSGTGEIKLGELYITNYGYYEISGSNTDPGTHVYDTVSSGNLAISGTTSELYINGSQVYVDGASNIYANGTLTNNALRVSGSGGFVSDGLTTVYSGGLLNSDNDSTCLFNSGLTVQGEANILDDATIIGNLIIDLGGLVNFGFQSPVIPNVGAIYVSGYLYMYGSNTVLNNNSQFAVNTFGTFGSSTGTQTATFNNNGYTDVSNSSFAAFGNDINVQKTGIINSDGPLTTGDNMIVSSGGTVNLNDNAASPDDYCQTWIGNDGTGNLTINQDGTDIGKVTVNCTRTTSSAELTVFSNTYVYGELELNSGMLTQNMIIGEPSAAYTGSVYHKPIVDLIGDNAPDIVFLLTITHDLTINPEGEINVSALSYIKPSSTHPYAGVFGGKGQYSSATGITEYGTIETGSVNFGRAGEDADRDLGAGGGKAQVVVGNDAVVNGPINADGESVKPNFDVGGGTTYDCAGSGGSVFLTIGGALSGSGDITARGGDSTPDISGGTAVAMAGGGGRIYIEYYDKSAYTGKVKANGGAADRDTSSGGLNLYHAGTGTVFYKWTDPWANENDGTLVIDPDGSWADIDFSGTGTLIDATTLANLTDKYLDVESVQIEPYGSLHLPGTNCAGGTCSKLQQCLKATPASFFLDTLGEVLYNRDHGSGTIKSVCIATPDPPYKLFINDPGTGAQSAINAKEGDPIATLFSLVPKFSAIHFDGRFDSTGTYADASPHQATHYEIQIADTDATYPTSPQYLFDDNATHIICDIDDTALVADTDSGNRVADLQIPYAGCGEYLTANENYFYRVRFKEYDPANSPYWGLWSQTNWFELGEGGTIDLANCGSADLNYDTQTGGNFTIGNTLTDSTSGATGTIIADVDNGTDGTLTIHITSGTFSSGDTITDGTASATVSNNPSYKLNIGPYDSSTGDNFFADYCNFNTEATVTMHIKATKDDLLSDESDPYNKIRDMIDEESDSLPDMDGTTVGGVITNESGFYLSNVNTSEFTVGEFNIFGDKYTDYWSNLPPNSPSSNTVLTSSGGYLNESFTFNLGAFIHGLIPHPTDPINNDPAGTACNGNPLNLIYNNCVSLSGNYSMILTLTASTTP